MRKQLTEAMLEKLGRPSKGRREIFDAIVPALAVRVTSGGAKTFVVRARIKGRAAPIRVTIGDATVLKVSAARDEATELLKLCRAGKDPRVVRRAEREAKEEVEALKWEAVVALFIEKHAKKNKSWRETAALFAQRVTPAWRGRPLASITRKDVVRLLDKAEATSVYRANATLAAVRKLFNWAVLRGMVDTTPIVPGMAREGVVSRDRFLTFDEIALVWRSPSASASRSARSPGSCWSPANAAGSAREPSARRWRLSGSACGPSRQRRPRPAVSNLSR